MHIIAPPQATGSRAENVRVVVSLGTQGSMEDSPLSLPRLRLATIPGKKPSTRPPPSPVPSTRYARNAKGRSRVPSVCQFATSFGAEPTT